MHGADPAPRQGACGVCAKATAARPIPNADNNAAYRTRAPSPTLSSSAWLSSGRRPRPGRQIVANRAATLHHEFHAFHFSDVSQRIAGDRNEVGVLAFLDAA